MTSYATCQGKDATRSTTCRRCPTGVARSTPGDCAPPADVFAVSPNGSRRSRGSRTRCRTSRSVTASPDGSRLAFTRTVGAQCVGCDQRLWVTNADGGDARQDPARGADRRHPPGSGSELLAGWIVDRLQSMELVGRRFSAPLPRPAAGGAAYCARSRRHRSGVGAVPDRVPRPEGRCDGRAERYRQTDACLVSRSSTKVRLRGRVRGGSPCCAPSPPLAILIPSTGKRISLPGLEESSDRGAGLAWSPDGKKLAFVATTRRRDSGR